MSKQSTHDKITRRIAVQPFLIGLDGIVLSTGEAHLHRGRDAMIGEPDVLAFDPRTMTLYNIEYKCTDSKGNDATAFNQLTRTGDVLQCVFKEWDIVDLYVSGNYEVKKR